MTRALLALLFATRLPPSTSPPPSTSAPSTLPATRTATTAATTASSPSAPPPLACIARHYVGVPVWNDAAWSLALPSGERLPAAEVEGVYAPPYTTGAITKITDPDDDPGRVRLEPVMLATYGATAAAVQAQLVEVPVRGQTFRVHARVAAPLRRVAARLDLAARSKEGRGLGRFFASPGGTFNWRFIAGTRQLSMHAWGIALDLDPSLGDYWRNVPESKRAWKNRVPQVIVDAFEAEGFIWGGRWFHYDTMHFEYRPELLDPTCYPRAAPR